MASRHNTDRPEKEKPSKQTGEKENTTEEKPEVKSELTRRTSLKLAGAVGSIGVLPFASRISVAQSDGESYQTITLSDGEQRTITVDDGETFENVLVDQRADNCHLRINTNGNANDFTIRNIGFLGVPQGEKHVFNLAGSGVVENVFLDGRRRNGQNGTKMGAFRMKRSHSGRIEIRNTFVAGMGNNASYASSAGKNNGGNGAVVYENCYHRDNTVSNYRPGTEGSRIRNCVSIANDPEGLRGPYPHSGVKGCRGAWVKHYPDQRIENCAFYMSPDDYNPNETVEARHFSKSDGPGVEVTIVDTGVNPDAPRLFNRRSEDGGYARIITQNIHDNPTVGVLQDGGVPLNAEMAASGQRTMPPAIDQHVPPGGMDSGNGDGDSGTQPDLPESHTLAIDGSNAGWTDYSFTVDEELSEDPSAGSLGTGDSINGTTAEGFVNGGVDSYLYTSEITSLTLDGDAALLIDGEEVDPALFEDSSDNSSGDLDLSNSLVIDGSNAERTDYAFTVDGEIAENPDNGSLGTGDAIDGNSAGGFVNGGVDGYVYSGEITEFSIDGDAAVLVNGDVVDPASLGDTSDGSDDTDNSDGSDGSDNTDGSDGSDGSDGTDGSDGSDGSDGTNDDDSSSGTDLPNMLVIDGTSSSGTATYTFAIDGEIEKSDELGSAGSGDVIHDDGTVEGFVNGGVDGYVYSGDITHFTVDGNAQITFEDNDG